MSAVLNAPPSPKKLLVLCHMDVRKTQHKIPFLSCSAGFHPCAFADEYKSELGQQLTLIAGSLVGGVCIVSLVAVTIICTR